MAAYLIAQLGKNYANDMDKKITGKAMIELAWMVIEDAQYLLGGMVTFLEAENKEKLLSFYRDNHFSQFDPCTFCFGRYRLEQIRAVFFCGKELSCSMRCAFSVLR